MLCLQAFANKAFFYSFASLHSSINADLAFFNSSLNTMLYAPTILVFVILSLIIIGAIGIFTFYHPGSKNLLKNFLKTLLGQASGPENQHPRYRALIAEYVEDTPAFLSAKLAGILRYQLKGALLRRHFCFKKLRRRFPIESDVWKNLVNNAPKTHDVLMRGLNADVLLWAKTDKAGKRLKLVAFQSQTNATFKNPSDFGPSELEPLPVDHLNSFAPVISLFALAQFPVPENQNKTALKAYAFQVDKLSRPLDQALSSPPVDMPSSFRFCLRQLQAWAWFVVGMAYSDPARLGRAIRAYEKLLAEWPSGLPVFLHGQILSNLAMLKLTYAQRLSGLENLEQSLDALDEAQSIFTRVDYPEYWARLQELRAHTQIQLGQKQHDASLLETGIQTLRTAARIWNTPTYELRYAEVQKKIARILRQLSAGSLGSERLEQAASAYSQAMSIYQKHSSYKQHSLPNEKNAYSLACTQVRLSETLVELGERSSHKDRFSEALRLLQNAIPTLKRYPEKQMVYAKALLTLGRSCTGLCQLYSSHNHFQEEKPPIGEAVRALKKANKIWPEEAVREKIQTLETLGIMLACAAELERAQPIKAQDYIEESITVLRQGLELLAEPHRSYHHKDSNGPDPARLYTHLGRSLELLGGFTGSDQPLQEASEVMRKAIRLTNRETSPWNWAMLQNGLGNILYQLAKHSDGANGAGTSNSVLLDAAIQAYRNALSTLRRENSPLFWAQIRNKLGEALALSGALGGGTPCLELAIESYGKALEEWTSQAAPQKRAITLSNMANVLADIGRREDNGERIEQAKKAFSEAYDLFSSLGQSHFAKRAHDNISAIERVLLKEVSYDPAATFSMHLAE